MPQPTPASLHVDSLLTDLSVAYKNAAEDFIAEQVFPPVPVRKQSDFYAKYTKDFWLRAEMKKRAPGTDAADGGYGVDNTNKYSCDEWALRQPIDEQDRANADDVFDLEEDAADYLTQQYLLRRDKDWAATYFATSVWDTDRTGVGSGPTGTQFLQWDQSGSTPFQDIRLSMWDHIKAKTGLLPNTLVCGPGVWRVLADHPDLVDRIKGGANNERPAVATQAQVAAILGLDRVLVAASAENTAKEGATFSGSFVFGKKALLCYAAPSPGRKIASAGYSFIWTGLMGGVSGQRILRYRKEPHVDYVEINAAYDHKVVAADLGVFFETAVG